MDKRVGDATVDQCGTCDNNPDNDCTEDCNGILWGDANLEEWGSWNWDG